MENIDCKAAERRQKGGGLTGKDLMFHTATFFSGTHLALPVLVLNLGESASLGTGTRMHTLLAVERLLNWLRAWRVRGQGSGVRGQGSGVRSGT